MKKVFTLLTLLLAVCSGAWATIGDTFTVTFNGSAEQTQANYFTISSSANYNTKFTGATYETVTYTSGLKMESSTSITWTAEAEATVIILQSDWESKTVAHGTPKSNKLDDVEIPVSDAESGTGYKLYTITNVAAGNHSITRKGGENGLFMIKVIYTSESVDIVANPTISWNSSTNTATISCLTGGATVYFTTDGTVPTTLSPIYSSEITLENSSTICAFAKKGETESNLVKQDCYVNHTSSAVAVLNRGDAADAPTWTNGLFSLTSDDTNDIQYYTIFSGRDGFKLNANTTYTIEIPEGIKITSVKLVGKSRGDAVNATTVSFTGFTPGSSTFEKGGFVKTAEYMPSSTLDYGDDISFEVGGNQFGAYIELYGDIKTYAVTYAAGANGTGTVAAGEKKYGLDFTLSSNTFTRDGYTQTGWATSDGGPQVYALGGTYTTNEAITLYPVWSVIVATEVGSWDFTNWSDETKTGVLADETNWNRYEKAASAGTDLGETGGRTNVSLLSKNTLKYGTTIIPETNGLKFSAPELNDGKNIALIFDKKNILTEYDGNQYIWLMSSSAQIVIPSVKAGSLVSVDIESHKTTEERTITAKVGSTTLTEKSSKTGAKTKTTMEYVVTADGDVTIAPSNKGLHILKIKVTEYQETVPVSTLTDRNYATCVPTKKLDFSAADGITAYIATGLNGAGNAVVISPVDVVAAGTPIIMKTDTKGATVNVPVTTAAASDASANLLVAGDGTTAWNGTAGTTYYYLASDLFHEANEGTLQSGKAYLAVTAGAARDLSFVFADDSQTTGINAVENKTVNGIYNLNGQRIAQPTKGLYIVNGKKVIIK